MLTTTTALDASPATHPLRLWYQAETGRQVPPGPATCWLCAGATLPTDTDPATITGSIHADLARLAKGVFSSSFMDHDKGRGGSEVICPACAAYFTYVAPSSTGKGASGKLFTWHLKVFRSHWQRWDRETMADDVLAWLRDGLPEDGAFGVTYSHKKHTLPWSRVTVAGSRQVWIRLDGAEVCLRPDTFPPVLAAIAALWMRGYNKRLLAAGHLHPMTLARSDDPATDLATVALIQPHVGSPLPELCSYLVTEATRARHTHTLATLLPSPRRPQPARGAPAGAPQRRRRSGAQKPLPAPLVADAGGARQTGGADQQQSDGVEQYDLFTPRR